MRKAVIDLDWLDNQIASEKEKMERHDLQEHFRVFERGRNMLKLVRVKCTPIEQPFEFVGSRFIQVGGNVSLSDQSPSQKLEVNGNIFLSKTCLNDWESNKYCEKEGSCEMCKLKQK